MINIRTSVEFPWSAVADVVPKYIVCAGATVNTRVTRHRGDRAGSALASTVPTTVSSSLKNMVCVADPEAGIGIRNCVETLAAGLFFRVARKSATIALARLTADVCSVEV